MVDDRVDRDGRLAGLAVADDQLALATADGDHRVDGQDAGLHGLVYRLAGNDAGSLELPRAHALGFDGALAVDRNAQRVDHAAQHLASRRDFHDTASRADLVVLLDCRDVTQEHGAHFVFLEVLGQAVDGLAALPREFQKFAGHGVLQAVDARNAVADLDDGADLARLDARVQGVKLLAQRFVDRLCGDFSH